MKLRNKKTGEIIKDAQYRNYSTRDGFVISTPTDRYSYKSLKDFCEEWEDYVPKEPRINDEDARDSVYSWASSLQIQQVKCEVRIRGAGVEVTAFKACGLLSTPIIEFPSYIDANVADGKIYTIAELCGEEEE